MKSIYEDQRGRFTVSTDPARFDSQAACDFLARTYWAKTRPRERSELSFANSLVFGLYDGKRLIGMARAITDYSLLVYICDVFIHEDHRGQGLGRWLMECMLAHPDLAGVRRWLLTTDDAHGLYSRYGFEALDQPRNWMQRVNPFPGEELSASA